MKARDLTPACIGRQIKVERDQLIEGRLDRIAAVRSVRGYLHLYLTVDGWTHFFTGTETVSITG